MVEEKKTESASKDDGGTKQPAAAEPAAKKRKRLMVIGIVVVILAAVGIGFSVWHSQPTFCNAVCHTPMDSYVASYYNTDGTQLANVHMKAGKNCLSCHPGELGEQITEAGHWMSGDYAFDSASGQLLAQQDVCHAGFLPEFKLSQPDA